MKKINIAKNIVLIFDLIILIGLLLASNSLCSHLTNSLKEERIEVQLQDDINGIQLDEVYDILDDYGASGEYVTKDETLTLLAEYYEADEETILSFLEDNPLKNSIIVDIEDEDSIDSLLSVLNENENVYMATDMNASYESEINTIHLVVNGLYFINMLLMFFSCQITGYFVFKLIRKRELASNTKEASK